MPNTHFPARPLVCAIVVTLLVALLIPQGAPAETTSRVLEITSASAKPTVDFRSFDANPLRVFDINGDGRKEIVSQNENQWVYVFDSKTGELLFETTTLFPEGWGARSFNGPEVAVFSSGGKTRLIVQNSAAVVTSFLFDPAQSTTGKLTFLKEWERRLEDCRAEPGADSKPVLADLDADGTLEILAATEESGVYAIRANGDMYWKNCIGGGNAEPSVGDVDQDGKPEVVFGSDGGVVTAMDGRTGATKWSYSILDHYDLGSASIPVGVTIAQLDGIAGPDIVLGARDSHDESEFDNDHALLLALDGTGKRLWGVQDPEGNPLTYTRPVVVDADKDGNSEVYWGDWNTIGHKPPWNEADAWKVTGPGNFYRFDHQGNQVWRTSLESWWSNKDVPLADVDDDGVQEMLANGPGTNGHDGVWYLDSATGKAETFVDLYPWKLKRAPVIADLAGTGTMQWVAQADAADSTAGGPGILVYDTGVAYDSAWPHPPVSSFQQPHPTQPVPHPTGTTTSRPSSTTPSSSSSGSLPPIVTSALATVTGSSSPSPTTTSPSTNPTASPTMSASASPSGPPATTEPSTSADPNSTSDTSPAASSPTDGTPGSASPATQEPANTTKDVPAKRGSPSVGPFAVICVLAAAVAAISRWKREE